jgi:hypothetical protein
MRERCRNPTHHKYPLYGGRRITVCDRWLDSFENFLADMGERPKGKTLDRINQDGDYEPMNCRWAEPTQQNRNRRGCLTVDQVRAIRHALEREKARAELAVEYGVSPATIGDIARGKTWRDID